MQILSQTIVDEPTPTDDITLNALKEYLRVDYTADDSVLTAMLTAAWKSCENYCSRLFQTRTVEVVFQSYENTYDGYNVLTNQEYPLPLYPIASINSVKSRDNEGNETTLTVNDDYYLISPAPRAIIRLVNLATTYTAALPTYIVNYEAGYATPPEPFLEAVKAMVGYMYENRGNQAISMYGAVTADVRALLHGYREPVI